MTISSDDELDRLKEISRIVANTLAAMGAAIEPGMTTGELFWKEQGPRLLPSFVTVSRVRPASASPKRLLTAFRGTVGLLRVT
jgi:hypothetical protein